MHVHRPPPHLRPYVRSYWGYQVDAGPPTTHQGVPSGHLTFLLCLDGAVEMLRMPDPSRPTGSFKALVGGLHDSPAVIAMGEPQTGMQLELTWRGARALLAVPAAALAGDVVDLASVVGRRTAPLLDRLASVRDWSARFALLDAELTGWLRFERGVRPEVGRAWDVLTATGGTARIEALARDVGWSRRHLAEVFRRETGLGPKTAARLIRFERACDRLREPRRPALADVAAAGGYVDQAHLARDFRELAGMTATQWLAERPDSANPPAGVRESAGRPGCRAGSRSWNPPPARRATASAASSP